MTPRAILAFMLLWAPVSAQAQLCGDTAAPKAAGLNMDFLLRQGFL